MKNNLRNTYIPYIKIGVKVSTEYNIHSKLCNINPYNFIPSLISRNPRERMFLVWISLFVVTFPPICHGLRIQEITTKEFKPHASHSHHCSYCHYYNVDFVLFHNITYYTNSPLSHIHLNTTQLLNITCTLVSTRVILWSFRGCLHHGPWSRPKAL